MHAGPLHLLFPLLAIFPRSVHVYTGASFRSLLKRHLFSMLFCAGKDFLVGFAAELPASTTLNK